MEIQQQSGKFIVVIKQQIQLYYIFFLLIFIKFIIKKWKTKNKNHTNTVCSPQDDK